MCKQCDLVIEVLDEVDGEGLLDKATLFMAAMMVLFERVMRPANALLTVYAPQEFDPPKDIIEKFCNHIKLSLGWLERIDDTPADVNLTPEEYRERIERVKSKLSVALGSSPMTVDTKAPQTFH